MLEWEWKVTSLLGLQTPPSWGIRVPTASVRLGIEYQLLVCSWRENQSNIIWFHKEGREINPSFKAPEFTKRVWWWGSREGLPLVFGWNRVGIVKNIFYSVKPSFSQGNMIFFSFFLFFSFFFFLFLFVFICVCWWFGIRDFWRALFGMYDRQLETP